MRVELEKMKKQIEKSQKDQYSPRRKNRDRERPRTRRTKEKKIGPSLLHPYA